MDAVVGRAAAARTAADGWPKEAPWGAWSRAVRLRAGCDWKQDGCAATATVIERLAHARALALRQGCGGCAAWLVEQKGLPDLPDWGRLVCEGGIDVENGHQYARGGFPADLVEISQVWQHFHPETPFTAELLPTALSVQSTSAAPVRVLSEARWAQFLSRHLGHRLYCIHEHAVRHWGVKESADEIRELCARKLARIPLMPAIRAQFVEDPSRSEQAQKAVEAAIRRPELMGTWSRWALVRADETQAAAGKLPPAQSWFVAAAPRGTAYQSLGRVDLLGPALKDPAPAIEGLLALGNREPCLLQRLAGLRIPANAPDRVAQLTRLYGADADIDLALAKDIAYASHGEKRIRALKTMAEMDPNRWAEVADALGKAGKKDESMEAWDQFFRLGRNRVWVANVTEPLINWHADHQRLDRAKEIAAHNYEVFSYRGIASKANLDERLGDLDAAEACWKALQERYEDDGPMIRFWQRTVDKRPQSKQAMEQKIASLFPQGQRRVKLADFTNAPTKGVEIISESDLSRKYQVGKGQIIVAIDGVACTNQAQYMGQRGLSDGPLRIIVWDGKTYREVVADVPERRLQVDLRDYPQAKTAH